MNVSFEGWRKFDTLSFGRSLNFENEAYRYKPVKTMAFAKYWNTETENLIQLSWDLVTLLSDSVVSFS